jgi:hypothetical protein
MKPLKIFIPIMSLILFLSGCTTTKWIAPPYTNVEKILNVEQGMNINEVNATLGIEPYNVYNLQEDGSSILVYHYRTMQRRMNVPNNPETKVEVIRGEERSQTEGAPWYDLDHSLVYILFRDGRVESLMTDQGRSDAEYLLLVNNNIRAISGEELTTFKSVLDSSQYATPLIIPLSDTWKKTDEGKSFLQVKDKDSKGTALKVFGGLLLAGVTIALIVLSIG